MAMREGLRIQGRRGNVVVRRALIRYARWLRQEFDFPIRVPVYLHASDHIVTMHGERVTASFFAPWDRTVEPYIRVATGDYLMLSRKRGRNNALASFLCSLSHESIHYRQWVETGDVWEAGVARQAQAMVRRYARTRKLP